MHVERRESATSLFPPASPAAASDPPRSPFRIEVQCADDATRLAPVGDLNSATIVEVEEHLREICEVGYRRVVLDLRNVTFIASSASSRLLIWHTRAKAQGIDFVLIKRLASTPPHAVDRRRPVATTPLRDPARYSKTRRESAA